MSLRGLWIVSCLPSGNAMQGRRPRVVFARRFPTTEHRTKKQHGDSYVPLPSDTEFEKALFHSLGLDNPEFVDQRDSARQFVRLPVLTLQIHSGQLWPVIVIEQNASFYCCLPFIEQDYTTESKPPLIELHSISVSFSVLMGIANFLGSSSTKIPEKLPQLNTFLFLSMPFGHPRDTDPVSVYTVLSGETNQDNFPMLPSWRLSSAKGKQVLHITTREFVRANQCDQPDLLPIVDVYGGIFVKAELDIPVNEVSLLLSHVDSSKMLSLDGVIIHPCANSSVPQIREGLGHSWSHKLYFKPPPHTFPLCHYQATKSVIPPIIGMYKMRAEKDVKLLLQLKLSENIRNNFEYCEARLPFFNRGTIIHLDCKPSHGSVHINDRRNTLIWSIGQKFPSRTHEVSLTATVSFGANYDQKTGQSSDDPFCKGSNAYCSLTFRIPDFTYSGCHIDPKEVHIMPQKKVKLQIEKDFQAAEYKIWNTYGQVPYPVPSQDMKLS